MGVLKHLNTMIIDYCVLFQLSRRILLNRPIFRNYRQVHKSCYMSAKAVDLERTA
jgi:hypothetical protein